MDVADDATDDEVLDEVLDGLIHAADLDGLIRCVDDRVSSRDWAGLLRLRDRSRTAVRTGRQLWPAATLAEYRLALWAPAKWAVGALDDDAGRFTPGPLSEVIATHHTWDDLASHLPVGPLRDLIAHERSLRGDSIGPATADNGIGAVTVLDLPVGPCAWEPAYDTPVYPDDGCDSPAPQRPTAMADVSLPERTVADSAAIDDADTAEAFRALVHVWTDDSTGRAEVFCADGSPDTALALVGPTLVRTSPIDTHTALQWLVWAGATGAAHGRRRGVATARFNTWWLLATMCDISTDCDDGDDLGDAVSRLQWWWWDTTEPAAGWELRLVAHSPDDGLSWVFSAVDGG